MNDTKYSYGRKYATNNKQFLATFLWQIFPLHFPDFSLTAGKIPDISTVRP